MRRPVAPLHSPLPVHRHWRSRKCTTRAGSIDEAIAVADEIAATGDTVLLAPGCASFDMFKNYQHRGDVFAALVVARKERAT